MAPPKGHPKWGGRVAGIPNKPKPKPGVGFVRELLEQMGVDTFAKSALLAFQADECPHCEGAKTVVMRAYITRTIVRGKDKGKKKRELREDEITCPSCKGQGTREVPVNTQARLLMHLNKFQQPAVTNMPLSGPKDEDDSTETLDRIIESFHREADAAQPTTTGTKTRTS